ncbi:hypothetical protein Aduo_019707 [Ancylostoma duodenale]
MDIDAKIRAYRIVGYAAISFSAVAILSICITLPMVYNYVSHVRDKMNIEMGDCKESVKSVWSELSRFRDVPVGNRTARQTWAVVML